MVAFAEFSLTDFTYRPRGLASPIITNRSIRNPGGIMNQLATRELTLFSLGAVAVVLVLTTLARAAQPAEEKSTAGVATVDGMPAVLDPGNVYSEAGPGRFSPAVSGALERVYVPEIRANRVDVIDPATFTVVDQFRAGPKPQHVIPSWDLKTLWVAGSGRRHSRGSLTPIDPISGQTWCHHPRSGRLQYVFQPRR